MSKNDNIQQGSFNLGKDVKIEYYTINMEDLSKPNKPDFDKLISKYFERLKNRYRVFFQYEFYDANDDFIEEASFKKMLGKHSGFVFSFEDKVRDLNKIFISDKEQTLNEFNHAHLYNSTYKATDVTVFRDDKHDNIRITIQIKIEPK